MKSAVLLILFAFQAFAQQEQLCLEFDQKLSEAQRQIKDFERDTKILEIKVRILEESLAPKLQTLNYLLGQRTSLVDANSGLLARQNALKEEIAGLQREEAELDYLYIQKDQQRLFYLSQSESTINLNIKKDEKRLAEALAKELERMQPQVLALQQKLAQVSSQLTELKPELDSFNHQYGELTRQIELEQRNPSISKVQQELTQKKLEMSATASSFEKLKLSVKKAEELVTMCYGYHELSVKYPTVLDISRKVNIKGCNKYIAADLGNDLANTAQAEVLNSMCNR